MSTVNTYIPGRIFYLLLSADSFTTTYTLVCLMKQGLSRSRAVNKQESQCGIAKSYGEVDRTMSVEAINNTTPDAVALGVGQCSYKQIATWFEGNTLLKVRRKYPTADGTGLFMESECRVSKLDDTNDVANNMTFNFELELEGAIDETV